ncbi:hypothetical protein BDN72DRAFT_180665 [Pluteus cervinus]|uniref:Uncharacterized protein n=1 Tax=Pluteus cervinus TaxID=181527 RepID=A0ACD3AJA6_9AGAR|nr:hypothetical protein BDN72DRAFT_180665 [Pluteus cervinus]
MPDPRLPPELERVIFIDAFRNNPEDLLSLFLVAKRVQHWLVPFAFEVVIVHANRIFPLGFQSVSHFKDYGVHIQHLLVCDQTWQDVTENLDKCLTYCPNITNLGLWQDEPVVNIESILNLSKLTRLGVNVKYIVKELHPIGRVAMNSQMLGIALRPALFPNVTHLDVVRDRLDIHSLGTLLYHFPNLTHMTIECTNAYIAPLLSLTISRMFKRLQTLIWWEKVRTRIGGPRPIRVDDDRVVSIVMDPVEGWEKSARGEQSGIWEVADEMIVKRRR